MTASPQSGGFLMRDSWRADVVMAHKVQLPGGPHAPVAARAWIRRLLAARLDEVARDDGTCVWFERALVPAS